MRFILSLLFILGLFNYFRAKVILNFRIYNYRNVDNLKHDGAKCETLHHFGDHCDPVFKICISGVHPCDIFNSKFDFWKNKKSLYTVVTRDVVLEKFPTKVSIKVKVDDYDSYSESDHIAVFSSDFQITSINNVYRSIMSVYPTNLNVGLQASVSVRCAENFHGTRCEFLYNEHECTQSCGQGKCVVDPVKKSFFCLCDSGWSGMTCREFFIDDCSLLKCIQTCSYTETVKECICVSSGHNKKYCREIIRNKMTSTSALLTSPIVTSTVYPISTTFSVLSTEKSKKDLHTSTDIVIQTVSVKSVSTKRPSSTESVKFVTIEDRNKTMAKHESQVQPDENQKFHDDMTKAQFSPSMIIIICLLSVLCISIVALFFIIQHWHRKNKSKNFYNQRPLPPVFYQRDKKTEEPFKFPVQENKTIIRKSDNKLEFCTIGQSLNSRKESTLFLVTNEITNEDPYEEPIINNMESLTCETDCNDSDYSETYEVPIKSTAIN